MDGIEFVEQKCSRARFNACQSQCRIARFLAGGTIFDGNCPCEKPVECRFEGLDILFVEQTREPDDEDYHVDYARGMMFPDVKAYIKEVWSE